MNAETKHGGPVDVLETLAGWCNEHGIGKSEHGRRSATYAAVVELIEADKEYDAAIAAAKDLNRKVAVQGWFEVEFDALRESGKRVIAAQIRRDRALANVGSAP